MTYDRGDPLNGDAIETVADEGNCLTAAQVEAIRKVHDGLKDPKTLTQTYRGWSMSAVIMQELRAGAITDVQARVTARWHLQCI